ncbi:hypothetical protein [Neobacillus sp. DY30]|uniref:hypothetical protein n=1 Tax=Neobacillus sp. DY30 TaxID=3047871 RepID=UPI0024C02938|nr:hypothetical protein [Neobacillus sp. DY30]WHY01352.1 hypothetical protein QNH29_03615 [Neobacillus sp. DY30]
MPKISSFMYCQTTKHEYPESITPLNIIPIESKPGRFSFSVVYSIVGFDPNKDHDGYVIFSDPKGLPILETEKYKLPVEENHDNVVGDVAGNLLSGVTMAVEFGNLLLENEGLFKTELIFDGEKLGEFYIPVVLGGEEHE